MFVLAGIGGAAGAAVRYAVSRLFVARGWQPMLATLSVNLAGSLAIGVLIGLQLPTMKPDVHVLLGIGFLGGLTTYSTLNVQKAVMWNVRKRKSLLKYILATYPGGWTLTAIGVVIGQAAAVMN
jgi:CrcB protein